MNRQDLFFIACAVLFLLPFFTSQTVLDAYLSFNASHGMIAAFIKFAILSTAGELIGLRIATGQYLKPGFGVLPRAFVWGVLPTVAARKKMRPLSRVGFNRLAHYIFIILRLKTYTKNQ